MSDFRFGDGYDLSFYPHEASDGMGGVDWNKVERVEIEWVDYVKERTCRVESSRSHDYGYAPVGTVWEWDLSCGDTVEADWPPDYCPRCGAKVVE